MSVVGQNSATFRCCINRNHIIEWRVGAKEVNGMEYATGSILAKQGVIDFHRKTVNANKVLDVIQILPMTADWNNTAVQCVEINNSGRKIYSKFALLHLQPESPSVSGLFTFLS